jgi:hypothetical protein
VDFLGAAFPGVAFLAVVVFVGDSLAAAFFTAGFFTAAFLPAAFLLVESLAADFLAAAFATLFSLTGSGRGVSWITSGVAAVMIRQNLAQLVGTQFLFNIGFDRGHETLQAPNVFARSARYARQALGPDDNQRDDADQHQLGEAHVKHMFLSAARLGQYQQLRLAQTLSSSFTLPSMI